MAATKPKFIPDESQQEVIDINSGRHLVLAPPGCGKTQILAERIRVAHEAGTAYEDMLCLTFTNRAARGMMDRIRDNVSDKAESEVFVGNVHRYCSHFLFQNAIVPADSSIIDDEEMRSILANFRGEDEGGGGMDFRRRNLYGEVMQTQHLMQQILLEQPRELRLHEDALTTDDIHALQSICKVHNKKFTREVMIDIYQHADNYLDELSQTEILLPSEQNARKVLEKLWLARRYERYKADNLLLDFEDLLILTFSALDDDKDGTYKRYKWVQIDEVQDLNPLQMRIVDELTTPDATVVYLGDEQQAIFSFMGAKIDTLVSLKKQCPAENIHHLNLNHRSPDYLLQVFNKYAEEQLHIDPQLLPTTTNKEVRHGDELVIAHAYDVQEEARDVVKAVSNILKRTDNETAAIIVNANKDADAISTILDMAQVAHFKVSGDDIFDSDTMKTLFAHFTVLDNDSSFMSWARIFKGLKVLGTGAAARAFTQRFFDRAMRPDDVLLYEDSTYLQEFVKRYDSGDIIVFDTETTGLDVCNDDILQIAAVRMRQGVTVEGSQFCVYLKSDRPIPAMLGDIPNPIIEERHHQTLLEPAEALRKFLDYARGCVLLGHNVNYDYAILDNNLRRYLPEADLKSLFPVYFDSLRLIRLLEPTLKNHKLKTLLDVLGLQGQNSHLADDDVNATCSLTRYCYDHALDRIPQQREWLGREKVRQLIGIFRKRYRDYYLHDRSILSDAASSDGEPILVDRLRTIYRALTVDGTLAPVRKFDLIASYIAHDIIDADRYPTLKAQIEAYIMTLSTLKEADLCGSSVIADRVFLLTVHKAKGLEFDNVFIFDAVDGRYPNYYYRDNPRQVAEDARKFYVAMSRAKRRVFVFMSDGSFDYSGRFHQHELTPFMKCIKDKFKEIG